VDKVYFINNEIFGFFVKNGAWLSWILMGILGRFGYDIVNNKRGRLLYCATKKVPTLCRIPVILASIFTRVAIAPPVAKGARLYRQTNGMSL